MSFIAGLVPRMFTPGQRRKARRGTWGTKPLSADAFTRCYSQKPRSRLATARAWGVTGGRAPTYFFVGIAEFLATCFGEATLTAVAVLSPLAVLV